MDPLQWMGAVRMRVQTADKKHHNNCDVIHTTPVHQLMSGEVKSCVYNIFYYIHNIAFSSEKVISSESGEKYA